MLNLVQFILASITHTCVHARTHTHTQAHHHIILYDDSTLLSSVDEMYDIFKIMNSSHFDLTVLKYLLTLRNRQWMWVIRLQSGLCIYFSFLVLCCFF